MSLKHEIKNICEAYDIRPSKSRGQNFLIDKSVLDKIVKTADLKKDDVVLEIGPGLGILTVELAKKVKKVYAIEFDKRIAEVLKILVFDYKNVEIIKSDILKLNLDDLEIKDYKIVSNLPYNITSAVLRNFLESKIKPKEMTVMVQKEVAQRIVAKIGNMSLLSVSVQAYSEPKIVSLVSKSSFWPIPEVDSAILKIKNIKEKFDFKDEKFFFRVVKVGFSARRKKLYNNLSAGFKLSALKIKEIFEKVGINEDIRPQGLSIKDWSDLAGELSKYVD